MIIDHIRRAEQFYVLGIGIRAGLQFLARPDLSMLKGRYDLPDSGGSYAVVQEESETRLRAQSKWEAHRKMIDIQFLIHGKEMMGYTDISNLMMEEYHDDGDYCLGEGDGDWLHLDAQYFMILFPQDAHMPSIAFAEPQKIKKVVVKVPVETLRFSPATTARIMNSEVCSA